MMKKVPPQVPIVKQCAAEFGLTYVSHQGLHTAIQAHLRYMGELAKQPDAPDPKWYKLE